MSEKNANSPQVKKKRAPRGERSQTPVCLRIDNDLLDWLSRQPNKGRYINDLIRADCDKRQHAD